MQDLKILNLFKFTRNLDLLLYANSVACFANYILRLSQNGRGQGAGGIATDSATGNCEPEEQHY